jgi:gas vesicle protein
MENIKNAITVVEELEEKYALSTEDARQIEQQYNDFKVFVPLIGRFSAGKSALINNVLDYGDEIQVCMENIGVQTAIPAEIFYGDEEKAWICRPEKEEISIEEYLDIREELSTKTAEAVKIQLENENLQKFPSVALVDMPGLDSGYEVHDMAINDYIKKSMAYVLVFPADELTIPDSMGPILRDLSTYHMPMCVVITKGNRIAGKEEERKAELRNSLARYFDRENSEEIPIFVTETETGQVEGFLSFLESLETQANVLGKQYYRKKLEPEFSKISNYLTGYLKNMELTLSELEEEKDRLEEDINCVGSKVQNELDEFTEQIPEIVNEVAMDVQAALSQEMESLVWDLVHDTDVSKELNEIIRSALTASYQSRVMKTIKKHLKNISEVMSIGSTNYASAMRIDIDKVCGKEISGIGRTAIDVIALLIGGPLGGIIAHVITDLFNQNKSEKRKEAERKVREQLSNSVFPAIDKEVREKVQMDLERISMEVRETVEKDVNTQMEALQKSLHEVMEKKQKEDELNEQKKIEMEHDIRVLEGTQDGIK